MPEKDTLRHDLLQWLLAWSTRARLCVSLGTSLCGVSAALESVGTLARVCYVGCLKGGSKSVLVLLNGIEAGMVGTLAETP